MKMTGKQESQYSYQTKTDFKMKAMKKDKEGQYLMIKDQFKIQIIYSSIYMPLI